MDCLNIYGLIIMIIIMIPNVTFAIKEKNFESKYHNKAVEVIEQIGRFASRGFMRHEYSQKREVFLEEDGRLVFLAFLSPTINGSGFAFKEVKGGEEEITVFKGVR
ncbi:hypothetical protein EXN53_03960 [Clostridium botulinum]|nr:hypothetical protein [Clostridium botulinum]